MAKPNAFFALSSLLAQKSKDGEENMPARFDEKAWLGTLLRYSHSRVAKRNSKFAIVQAIQLHDRSRSKLSTNSAKKQSNEKPYRAGQCLAGPPSRAAQVFSSFLKN
jgi:hypothetical protein